MIAVVNEQVYNNCGCERVVYDNCGCKRVGLR